MSLPEKLRRIVLILAATGFVIACILPATSVAQEATCKVTLSALPAATELKGFHLGMTTEQVKTHVPHIIFGPTDELGVSKTTINPNFDPRTEKSTYQDVRSVSLDFLDGRLVSLWIGYEGNFKWTTVDDFVNGISQSLTLPNAWSTWKLRGKQMTCADFQLTVSLVAQSPSFRIVDRAAEEILTARRVAKEEEKSAAEAAEAAAAESEADANEIIGDRKTKAYYPPGCRPASEIGENQRVSFKTIEEAVKAGYKPARACS